jgi:hypothetical protein
MRKRGCDLKALPSLVFRKKNPTSIYSVLLTSLLEEIPFSLNADLKEISFTNI